MADGELAGRLLHLAHALGWSGAEELFNPAGANGCVGEVVEHGHRAMIKVDRTCAFEVRLYRCGAEGDGPVAVRVKLTDLANARAEAERMCEGRRVAQLGLFDFEGSTVGEGAV